MKRNRVRTQIAIVLLSCCVFVFSLAAETSPASLEGAPKLLEAIDDQTLVLNPEYTEKDGLLPSQQIFYRDLNRSFRSSTAQDFLAYPYDKTVADAWVVDSYLIVLAKSTGTAQVAVTAKNQYGSMIDWFIVHVEERGDAESSQISQVDFQYDFPRTVRQNARELHLQLPATTSGNFQYAVVPELPIGLSFDFNNRSIRGRAEGPMPDTAHYWVAVSSDDIGMLRFSFNALKAPSVVSSNDPGTDARSFDISDLFVGRAINAFGQRTSTPSNVSTPGSVAASLPYRESEVASTAYQQSLLYGITNAMHSRFRSIGIEPALSNANVLTVWNYASTGNALSSSRLPTSGVEPTGIYVGFDTQIDSYLTTGFTLGFDRHESSLAPTADPSRLHFQSDANLSSVMPYARWQDGGGVELWGVLGIARDAAPFSRVGTRTAGIERGNLLLGAVGWRQLLRSTGNLHLTAVGDAGLTVPLDSAAIGLNPNIPLAADSGARSLRAGLEMSLSGELLNPYVGLSGILNSDLESRATTLEALGGIRYESLQGLTFEAEGRALSADDVFQNPELIFSVAAHLDPGLRGEGLALSVAPVYAPIGTGMVQSPLSTIDYFRTDAMRLNQPVENAWAMSGSLSYGLAVRGSGVITPFGQISISTMNQTRMGVRVAVNSNLDRIFNLEIATVQSRFEQEALDNGVDIQLRLVF